MRSLPIMIRSTRQIQVTLVQSTNGDGGRYAKLCTEVIEDGKRVSVSRIDLTIEQLGSLLCGLVVEATQTTETRS